jgi:Flp pilus assembly protein TadD
LAISQERAGDWDNAEKNFYKALKISPKQAEVLNYLAYSWLEKN